LLGSRFQQRTSPFLWTLELSRTSATSSQQYPATADPSGYVTNWMLTHPVYKILVRIVQKTLFLSCINYWLAMTWSILLLHAEPSAWAEPKHHAVVVLLFAGPLRSTADCYDYNSFFELISLICIRVYHYHHHHWHDSPLWALAFLKVIHHSSLFNTTFIQFFTPGILMSWRILLMSVLFFPLP
jgi:hypothetical protein